MCVIQSIRVHAQEDGGASKGVEVVDMASEHVQQQTGDEGRGGHTALTST